MYNATHLESEADVRETNSTPDRDEDHDTIADEKPSLEADWHMRPKGHEANGADHSRDG